MPKETLSSLERFKKVPKIQCMDESLSDPEDRKGKSEEKVENTNTKKKIPRKVGHSKFSAVPKVHVMTYSICISKLQRYLAKKWPLKKTQNNLKLQSTSKLQGL